MLFRKKSEQETIPIVYFDVNLFESSSILFKLGVTD